MGQVGQALAREAERVERLAIRAALGERLAALLVVEATNPRERPK
jgi:hypothetical protein